jgi:hypothetical protein
MYLQDLRIAEILSREAASRSGKSLLAVYLRTEALDYFREFQNVQIEDKTQGEISTEISC